ncbi:hypothetical protein BN8_04070 [Fibrisoma limi BUZ 3]|uniref:Uncharacterized protein n=1 Tax=Fibrisoma limi BUZ 3 TaxID=1185876 RepID=I2GLT1_9BACT|nr:hypothetical protein BN8_04070 [Fibrisoma limi BUZ 3]
MISIQIGMSSMLQLLRIKNQLRKHFSANQL